MTTKNLSVALGDNHIVSLELPWEGLPQKSLYLQIGYWPTQPGDEAKVLHYLRNKVQKFLYNTKSIFNSLPIGSTIVDIGAGNSIVDLFLDLAYPDKKFNYVLVDSNEEVIDDTLAQNVHSCQHSFTNNYYTYNNWDFVKQTINTNGLDAKRFTCRSPADFSNISSCDVVVSLASWGWHYPIDTYLKTSYTKLNSGGYMYLNPVLNVEGANQKLTEYFGTSNKISYLEFNPNRYQPVERERLQKFLADNQIASDRFAFAGIWKKR